MCEEGTLRVMEHTGQEGRRGKEFMGKGGAERGKQGHAEGTGGVR